MTHGYADAGKKIKAADLAYCLLPTNGQRMWNATVTVAAQHLRNDHLVAIEPLRLTTLDCLVCGVRHQRLQGFHRVPVVHVGKQPSRCVLPRLFSQVARNGLRKRGNFLIELVKLIGQRLDGEGECAAVHGVNGVKRDKETRNEDQGRRILR